MRTNWVSTVEQNPNENGPYLAYRSTSFYQEVSMLVIWYDKSRGWWVDGISHWMPLPEPPKVYSYSPTAYELALSDDGLDLGE